MKLKRLLWSALAGAILLLVVGVRPSAAQVIDRRWSEPFRLSTDEGSVTLGAGHLVADPYGYVHALWGENGFPDAHARIMYSRFDGQTWSPALDIYVSKLIDNFGNLADPVVDNNGSLHLMWTEGFTSMLHYARAPAHKAVSAQNWTAPERLKVLADRAVLQVDSKNVLHVVFTQTDGPVPGLYYIRSEDQGETWTSPVWLDPDKQEETLTFEFKFVIDPVTDALHVTWKYQVFTSDGVIGKDIRYAHSLDGGSSWSLPFIVDEPDESEDELRVSELVLSAYSESVHLIWAGTSESYREHRISTDAGRTWGPARRIFGRLHGGAGDTMISDTLGRALFLGQIRFPMGLYSIQWEGEYWLPPSLIYLIRTGTSTSEKIQSGDLIHVHDVKAAIRNGNQLVITFANSPAEDPRILYTMHTIRQDLPAVPAVPTPQLSGPEPAPILDLTAAPQPTAGAPAMRFDPSLAPVIPEVPSPAEPIWMGLGAMVFLVTTALVVRWFVRR